MKARQSCQISSHLSPDARTLTLFRATDNVVLLVQNCPDNARPYIHPLAPSDGHAALGSLTEDRPPHHPWQHGIYIGLNDVNGHGFWCEGLLPSHARDGTFHPTPIQLHINSPTSASWQFDCLYRGHEGQNLLIETQRWTLTPGPITTLDLDWTLRAEVDLRFGKYPYGGLFLRMPFTPHCHGQVLTSQGHATVAAAEQQRARWLAVSMLISTPTAVSSEDSRGTVAVLDHPQNPGHPAHWRVDDQLGVGPARCIPCEWHLPAGQSTLSRYRILPSSGPINASAINTAYSDFALTTARTGP